MVQCRLCKRFLPSHELGIRSWSGYHKVPYITCSVCDRCRRHPNFKTEDFILLAKQQDYGCYVCGKHELHIDHCHESGRVRGLLCNSCNLGLGNFKDDIELLLKAVEYLEEPNG